MRTHPLFLLAPLTFISIAAGLGCGSTPSSGAGGSGGGLTGDEGTVVIGLTSDLRVGVDIDRLHVVERTAGKVTRDEVLTSAGAHPLAFPTELSFDKLPDGTAIGVDLEAFGPGDDTTPLLTRTATTTILAGEKLLYRVSLDSACVQEPGSAAPSCDAPQTCVHGACQSADVDPHRFAPYSSGWADESQADICKPANPGPPTLIIGEGQADYLPLADGEVDQVEAGPQGGHHIWVALRMKNLRQSGSITSITGYQKDLDAHIGPFDVIFDFDQDEGGYCKLYGLRFQLDQSLPIDMLLGKKLDVTVTVTDKDGSVGTATKTVQLSDDFI